LDGHRHPVTIVIRVVVTREINDLNVVVIGPIAEARSLGRGGRRARGGRGVVRRHGREQHGLREVAGEAWMGDGIKPDGRLRGCPRGLVGVNPGLLGLVKSLSFEALTPRIVGGRHIGHVARRSDGGLMPVLDDLMPSYGQMVRNRRGCENNVQASICCEDDIPVMSLGITRRD